MPGGGKVIGGVYPAPAWLRSSTTSSSAPGGTSLCGSPAVPLSAVEKDAAAAPPVRDFVGALRGRSPLALIAEVKRASPSAGPIAAGADPVAVATTYEAAGVQCVSVLTDGPHFGGSLADLRAVRAAIALPLLRKDFLVSRYQLAEARAAGADAALLIAECLPATTSPPCTPPPRTTACIRWSNCTTRRTCRASAISPRPPRSVRRSA